MVRAGEGTLPQGREGSHGSPLRPAAQGGAGRYLGAVEARPRIVFLCIGNACRSPIAEGWLRHLAPERFQAASGGVHPIGVHPLAIRVMAERGIDISDLRSEYVHRHLDPPPEMLVALSLEALDQAPPLPAATRVLRWPVPDPYTVRGDEALRLAAFRATRDELEDRIREWLAR